MNNQWAISTLYISVHKLKVIQNHSIHRTDVFQPTLGLISCDGATERCGLPSHAKSRQAAVFIHRMRSSSMSKLVSWYSCFPVMYCYERNLRPYLNTVVQATAWGVEGGSFRVAAFQSRWLGEWEWPSLVPPLTLEENCSSLARGEM